MKIIAISLLSVTLLCCKNVKRDNQGIIIPERNYEERMELLNKDLTKELNSWIQFVTTKIDTVACKKICYTIEFYYKDLNNNPSQRDTIIFISYYNKGAGIYTGYKGAFYENNYYIAIIDKDNIGTSFYNKEMLLDIPIENFESTKVKNGLRPMELYKLKNGKLEKKHALL